MTIVRAINIGEASPPQGLSEESIAPTARIDLRRTIKFFDLQNLGRDEVRRGRS